MRDQTSIGATKHAGDGAKVLFTHPISVSR